MASEKRSFIQIVDPDEAEDAVVEVQSVAGKSGYRFWELGGSRVRVGIRALAGLALLGLLVAERGQRRFDAQTAFPAAALRGSLFRGSERQVAEGEKMRRRRVVEVRFSKGFEVGEEAGFGDSHGDWIRG